MNNITFKENKEALAVALNKGGGTSDVTKAYVDAQDTVTLSSAKEYADTKAYDDTAIKEAVEKKQDKLTAGTNITIEGNVISASGSGSSYDDTEVRGLIANNKTAIDTNTAAIENKANKSDIPTVPTKTSQLVNDSGFIKGVPSTYALIEYVDSKDLITLNNAKAYADTKAYDDTALKQLIDSKANKSDIPDISGLATKTELSAKVDKVEGKDLFSGSYTDLTNKPTIPAAYDDTNVRSLIADNSASILTKADKSTTYTKTEIDSMLGNVEAALSSIIGG